jgi:hypothetical protein
METPRPTTGVVIAGVGGVVLLISLFLPWYSVSVDITGFSASDSGSGREVLGFTGVLLYSISIAAIAIVVARAAAALPAALPVPLALLGLGALAVLLVMYRIIDIPTDGHVPDQVELSRKAGIFIALVGAAAVAYGGWRANTESRARRVARDAAPPPASEGVHKGRRRPEGRAAVGGLELR